MLSIINRLSEICHQYFFDEKILIVDSFQIGEQIRFHLAKNGKNAINLKTKTVQDLALDRIENSTNQKIAMMKDAVGIHFMSTIFRNLKEEKAFHYFHQLEVTPALSTGLYQMIKTLRLAGYKAASLQKKDFISIEKFEDIRKLLSTYETTLVNYNLFDDASLYQFACECIDDENKKLPIIILQPGVSFTFLEEKLLTKWMKGRFIELPVTPVYGLSLPSSASFLEREEGEPTPLSFLYDLENKKDKACLSLYIGKTEELELKKILSDIKQNEWLFDESAVFYTNPKPYQLIMYHLAEKLQIPVTFGEGLPLTVTKPGKLAYAVLNWMRDSYRVEEFLAILQGDLLELGEHAPFKSRIAFLLRKAQIGWGRERFLTHLKKEIEAGNEKLKASEEKQKEYYKNLISDFTWLYEWFSHLFKELPLIDHGSISYRQLLKSVLFMIDKYAKTSSGLDYAAKKEIVDGIAMILPYADGDIATYEAFLHFEELLKMIKVGQSCPKPGAIHFASYKQGYFVHRSHTFIVGLDNHRFPGVNSEDPLLLDMERHNLGNNLLLTVNEGKDKLFQMAQLLASSVQSVAVSYSNFDISENREVNPAHLFLQCYRFASGKVDADYRELQESFAPSINGSLLEGKDWWTNLFFLPIEKKLSESFMKQFPHIQAGLFAEQERAKPSFTVYDGKIESDTSTLDPRINHLITITAGKLEKLAKCPYAYFIEEVLEIKPLEEITYDTTIWLDAPTKGSILHEIFEKFYKALQAVGEKPSYARHEKQITELADKLIEEYREMVPPSSELVFEQEKEELLQSCYIFLKTEEEYSQDVEPLHFEYSFGIGETPPAIIKLPTGEIRLSGKIDRVDTIFGNEKQIIDYKTGSTYAYGQNKFFHGGRQLQHMLYALAAENLLKLPEGSVSKSFYIFPTTKSLGERYERIQSSELRQNGVDIIERLLDLLKSGHFPMSDDPDDCMYCRFKGICRRSFYQETVIQAKLDDPSAEGVKRFKGVRAYD